jgi:flagellar motor switch protein FliG
MEGVRKAAIFLMSLGEDTASEVLRHLGPKDLQMVGHEMTKTEGVTREQAEQVLVSFNEVINNQTGIGLESNEYVKKVLVRALGEDKAYSILERIQLGSNYRGIDQLKWLDAKMIAEMIRLEHPQIIAIVLAHLDSDHAAEVLSNMPERIRHDIIMRISTLDGIQPAALEELDMIMVQQFEGKDQFKSARVGGIQAAADILNFMDTSAEGAIMESIHETDSDLGEQIQDLMFVFADLADVDNRGIQTILREISTDILVMALKGCEETLRDKFVSNLSKRAAEMLIDDLENLGPVRVSEVEQAQKEILSAARRLSEQGQIMLGGSGEEFI